MFLLGVLGPVCFGPSSLYYRAMKQVQQRQSGPVILSAITLSDRTLSTFLLRTSLRPSDADLVVLSGLQLENDGLGGTFRIALAGLTPDGFDVIEVPFLSPYRLVRVGNCPAASYSVILNAPVPIVLPAANTSVEVTQDLALTGYGPWSKVGTARLRWNGQNTEMFIGYTLNLVGNAGDRIQAAFLPVSIAAPPASCPIVTLDASGYGSCQDLRLAQPCVTGTEFRVLVRNLTAGRNVTPTFFSLLMWRQAANITFIG